MADRFLDRVQCATTVLLALKGRSNFKKVSKTEADVLIRMVQTSDLQADTLAKAIAEAWKIGFVSSHEDDYIEVLSNKLVEASSPPAPSEDPAVAPATAPASAGSGQRLKQQNFESFPNFLPASAWQEMAAEGTVRRACAVLLKLGLRSPTEHTYKGLAVAYLLATEGAEKAREMPPDRRTSYIAIVRGAFGEARSQVMQPSAWQQQLEQTPSALHASRPDVYAATYKSEKHVAFPFGLADYEALRAHTSCRKTRGQGPSARGSASSDQNGLSSLMASMTEMMKLCMPSQERGLPGLKIFNGSKSAAQPLMLGNGSSSSAMPREQPAEEEPAEAKTADRDHELDLAVAAPPKKKPKLSVAAATCAVLDKMDDAADSKNEAKVGGKGKDKMPKGDGDTCRVRYEHVPADCLFRVFYNKMGIKVCTHCIHWGCD